MEKKYSITNSNFSNKENSLSTTLKSFSKFTLVMSFLFGIGISAMAQCPYNGTGYQYPAGNIVCPATVGQTVTAATNSYAGEHARFTGLVAGNMYTINITGLSPGYITVFNGTGATVLGYGPAPYAYVPTTSGAVRCQWTVDGPASCGMDENDHTTTMTLTAIAPTAPPAPTQAAGIPLCSTGADLTITGTPAAGTDWYWQTTATGTSLATPYTGPYTVFSNATYFVRTYNASTTLWSTASSVVVNNFAVSPTPPVPVANMNPGCISTGEILTAAPADPGFDVYWQGTSSTGTSLAQNASSTYTAMTAGTYYLRNYDNTSQCWSVPSSIVVALDTYIPPNPVLLVDPLNTCVGSSSAVLNASGGPSGGTVVLTFGTNITSSYGTMVLSQNLALPVGATVTSSVLTFNGMTTEGLTYLNDLHYSVSGAGTHADTYFVGSGAVNAGPFNYNVPINSINGAINLSFTNEYFDDATIASIILTVNYTLPVATFNWYDAAMGGTQLGTGTTLEAVGTTVLPNTSTAGAYDFYVQSFVGGCSSPSVVLATVNVSSVHLDFTAIDVSCNNGADGSFALGTVYCGQAPFNFAVDGGAFGPIPTTLGVGSHIIIAKDANNEVSSQYTIIVGDAPAPSAGVINTFNFDMVDLSWTGNGSETSWNVEWGAPGFTPGTGTEIGSAVATTSTNYIVSGLDGATEYDIYISANCGGTTTPGDWIYLTVTTYCDPIIAQGFCESFEDDSQTLSCWTVRDENADGEAWGLYNGTGIPNTGINAAGIHTDFLGGANDDYLITPLVSLTGNEIMNFHYRVMSAGEPNDFEVLLSTTGMEPADFTTTLMSLNSYSNVAYKDTALNLSAFTGNVYIAFHVPPGGLDGYYLFIDDVCIDICTPDAGTDGNIDVCRLDGTVDLNTVITQGETNGVWQFTPNQGAVNGSIVNITAIPDGTFEMNYIVTTACTIDTTVATLTIHPASSAGTNGQVNVCKNQPFNLLAGLTGLVDLGGTWYDPSNTALPSGQITSGALPGQFNYNYITNNGFCPNDTATVIVNISATCDWSGLEELNADAITVYPNPSTGLFYIANTDASQNFNYQVVDLNGRVIVENKVEINGSTTIEVDLTKVETGIYMIRLYNTYGSKLVRVVKQ